ncbi:MULTISPECIES: PAS domain-containing protein [Methanoculleus]|uniref:PAS/PAC sensor protein n=2 Tax=Methanoculleus TaxID=45989 RepID=A3CWS2_METMJ|nr:MULTISPECIES: PAS domain S-box protein [Methanoculleus]ABN57822.1 putative PAS/PAC sensor protein [Methanoculleus marisnigri JR1]MCC7554511.1 PAS domain S-box protein [Methanoculleus marisnigri]UYU19211.1 PAS domain S-box protein [Methanoculleus submarinus]
MTGNKTTRDDARESPDLGGDICLSILREVPDGLVLLDGKGTCRYLNPAFTRITGYTLEDVPTLALWFERAHPNPAYRQKVEELGQELFSGGRDTMVAGVVCRDGRVRDIEFRRASIEGGSVLFTARDVTEQALTEENLRQATSELTAVIEAFPDLFIRLNADGTILDSRAGRLAEAPIVSRAHLGRRVQDLLPAGVGEALSAALQEAVRVNTAAAPLEFSRTVAGETRHYEARVIPLQEMHLMVIIREITERKKAEEELHRHREHLEELVAERTAELERANKQLEQLLYYIEMTERKAAEDWLDLSVELGSLGADDSGEARITTDAAGTIVIVDMAAEHLTGYAGDELTGKPVGSLFSGVGVGEHLVREVLGQGRSVECAVGAELVRSDGSKEVVRVSGDPIADGADTVIGMVCTFRKA